MGRALRAGRRSGRAGSRGWGSLGADGGADGPHPGLIEAPRPAAAAERPPEAEIVGTERQQRRNVGHGERSGEAGQETRRPRAIDEAREPVRPEVTVQAAAPLLRRVEHDARKAEIPRPFDEREVRPQIGEHDQHDPAALPGRIRQYGEAALGIAAGEDPHLDDVDAERRRAGYGGGDAAGLHRQIAHRRADAPPAGNMRHHGSDGLRRQCAERAGRRLLEVDEIGAGLEHQRRLLDRPHACQHARHHRPLPSDPAR
ncbi:MAG: hypothetical protein BroJett029_13190 [Alphaproteobacteria bacterium]|nr:MAG: hypothetical protein BroJett029_13190 [Alphaproteobacteria bacterium]